MVYTCLMRRAGLVLGLLPCLVATGCYLKVDKSKGGRDKDVEVHLPIGGLKVQQNQATAQSIGLPAYPGASVVPDKDGSGSADVQLGFGEWQLHLSVAKYQSGDPQTKVEDFYRTALVRYGQVIECRDGHPVGSITTTREGLGCDEHPGGKSIHIGRDEMEFDLRAGSKRHQHIVGFSSGSSDMGTGTHFALVRLDLPAGIDKSDQTE